MTYAAILLYILFALGCAIRQRESGAMAIGAFIAGLLRLF